MIELERLSGFSKKEIRFQATGQPEIQTHTAYVTHYIT